MARPLASTGRVVSDGDVDGGGGAERSNKFSVLFVRLETSESEIVGSFAMIA